MWGGGGGGGGILGSFENPKSCQSKYPVQHLALFGLWVEEGSARALWCWPGPQELGPLQRTPTVLGGARRDGRPPESGGGQEHRGEPVADGPAGQRDAGQHPVGK